MRSRRNVFSVLAALPLVLVLSSTAVAAEAPTVLVGSFPQVSFEPSNARRVGGRIVFQRVLFGQGRIALFTVRPDGTDVRQLTDPPRGVETGRPDWSSDGQEIAYMWRSLTDEGAPAHVIVVWADGTHRRDLSREACRRDHCVGEEDPVWSPDGGHLAFTRQTAGPRSVFVMRSDGTHRRRVTRPPSGRYGDSAPSFSPDGRRIVFTRWDDARERSSLFVVAVDGSGLERITEWKADELVRPDWSPDGRLIVFSRADSHGRTQLHVIHPDGTGLHAITHAAETEWLWASFSPDGSMITAVGIPGEASENDVYVMKRDGTRIRPVTASLSRYPAEGLPDWGTG